MRAFYAALFDWDSPAGAPVAAAVSDQSSYSFLDPVPGAGPVAGGIGGGPMGPLDLDHACRRCSEHVRLIAHLPIWG
ncbi:hypothetical protein [Curtobacterium sp. BRB10]|uniref:hypothetical protein n=1 Tax=Curtobacterium sp. BRB10 TaxID=2962579 RepID=UPI0028822351|nr:hypothetical protein [Curtobacterium sp. BRB10]MDT0231950.1 hypothetical protein [Curtobacterium sp. BRB10]